MMKACTPSRKMVNIWNKTIFIIRCKSESANIAEMYFFNRSHAIVFISGLFIIKQANLIMKSQQRFQTNVTPNRIEILVYYLL